MDNTVLSEILSTCGYSQKELRVRVFEKSSEDETYDTYDFTE